MRRPRSIRRKVQKSTDRSSFNGSAALAAYVGRSALAILFRAKLLTSSARLSRGTRGKRKVDGPERTNGRTDGRTNERTNERTIERTNEGETCLQSVYFRCCYTTARVRRARELKRERAPRRQCLSSGGDFRCPDNTFENGDANDVASPLFISLSFFLICLHIQIYKYLLFFFLSFFISFH